MTEEAKAAAIREHGVTLGRVGMALLGDREATEVALERVARGATGIEGTGRDALVKLLGLVQRACATHLSKVPMTMRKSESAPDTARIGGAADAGMARAILLRLKPTERDAVVLHVVGGLEAREVAAAIGVDEATARARIARGIETMMEER